MKELRNDPTQYWRGWWKRTAYWLLLPLIGWSIWLATDWITNWVLNYSYHSTSYLQTNIYPNTQIARTLTITSIHARIERHNGIAEVTLMTTHSTLEKLEFKFPFTETVALETAIAKELNTTSSTIRSLIRYHVE